MSDLLCLMSIHRYRENRSPDGRETFLECYRCGHVKEPDDEQPKAS